MGGQEHDLRMPDGFPKYWHALIVWVAMHGVLAFTTRVFQLPFLSLLLATLIVSMGVLFRQRLRHKYGLEAYTANTLLLDVIAWSCCACCAIVQEGRHVDRARRPEDPPDDPAPEGGPAAA